MRGFDKHLHELLEARPEAALEYAKLFAELPLPTRCSRLELQIKKPNGKFKPCFSKMPRNPDSLPK